MKQQTLGLSVIAKNEEVNIRRLLENSAPFVDVVYLTDTGSTDRTVEVAQQICDGHRVKLEVSYVNPKDNPEMYFLTGDILDIDFAKVRNFNFSQIKTDWILWADADDTIEGIEKIKDIVDSATAQDITGVNFVYNYQINEKTGEKMVFHWKLRLVRNFMYEWTPKAPIHENLFILPEYNPKEAHETLINHHHWKDHDDFINSGRRNLRILKHLEAREGDKPDLRTVFLLGREHHAQYKYGDETADEALVYLHKYLNQSQYGGDRLIVCWCLCDIAERTGNFLDQEKYAFEAIKSKPDHALGYKLVAESYVNRGEWDKAIDFAKQALSKGMDEKVDSTMQNPFEIERDITFLLVRAYSESGDNETAANILDKYFAHADDKEKDFLQEQVEKIYSEKTASKILKALTVMSNVAIAQNKLGLLKHLIASVPEEIAHRQAMLNLKRKLGLNKEWLEGSIVVFVGPGIEAWDQDSTAIGGSETAVIEMTKRWGKAGYLVTVYGAVEEKKVFGNVTYLPADEINWADKFDIFIGWRNPMIFEKIDISARKRLFWPHDVLDPFTYTKPVLDRIDKIVALSNYHRSLLPAVDDEKFYISRNGIDVSLIEKIEAEKIERKPLRVAYTSSADRGLETLLSIWPDVLKAVPDAELIWAYGWDVFDKLRGDNPELVAWKEKMIAKMDELGVKQVGRLGKEDLYRLLASTSVWAYPTKFQEISCISAMEAQALGDYPVTSGFAALTETQLFGSGAHRKGVVLEGEEYTANLVNALEGRYDSDFAIAHDRMIENVKRKFSWDTIATEWCKDLFYGETFVQKKPLVTVVCITIRPGVFRILRDQLEKQTYKNLELVVVDGRYYERKKEVAAYFKDFRYPFLHLPDPKRDLEKYPYGLFHADNAGIRAANGELVVFLQDFIEIPEDGIEKFVNLYLNNPEALYTGVDTRNGFTAEEINSDDLIDVFSQKPYKVGEVQFTSPRIMITGARRFSVEPMEWELNYCAAPKFVLDKLGGWYDDWDTGFAYDNTQLALRFVYKGGKVIVDETNQAIALSHWDLFPADSKGVPHRDKKPNDNKYKNYFEFLRQSPEADVINHVKQFGVRYPKTIESKIKEFKHESD